MWVFLGAQKDVNGQGSPFLPAPVHTLASFFLRWLLKLETKDTLWKSEFHSLLAESSFLLREGVRMCVLTTTETGRGERHVGGWLLEEIVRWLQCLQALDGTCKALSLGLGKYLQGMNQKHAAFEISSGLKPSQGNVPLNWKARTFCKIIQKVC